MNDLTILFYSACRVEEPFFSNIRNHLLQTIGNLPLISVTHKPLDFGQNICVRNRPVSAYTLYQQVLIGAKAARTKYIACTEDDCLYHPSHFQLRPPNENTFIYNKNRYWCESDGRFRWRDRTGLHACIAPRQLMIDALERLFKKFPTHPEKREDMNGFAEPGRYEWYLKLPKLNMEYVRSREPILVFNRKGCLGGLRRTRPEDTIQTELEPWGSAKELWTQFHGNITPPPPIR